MEEARVVIFGVNAPEKEHIKELSHEINESTYSHQVIAQSYNLEGSKKLIDKIAVQKELCPNVAVLYELLPHSDIKPPRYYNTQELVHRLKHIQMGMHIIRLSNNEYANTDPALVDVTLRETVAPYMVTKVIDALPDTVSNN